MNWHTTTFKDLDILQKSAFNNGFFANNYSAVNSVLYAQKFNSLLATQGDWIYEKYFEDGKLYFSFPHNINGEKHGIKDAVKTLLKDAASESSTCVFRNITLEKSAHIMGMGYESVVKVPVDDRQRMDANALKSLVEADIKAGNIPYCVVATIGTTDFGSIDPVESLSEICRKYGMWLHADAAYGSGVILSEKYAARIAGLSKCDSITVDFHKMFMLPISCSAVLIKDGKNFDALTIHADYLNREEDEEDGYTNLVDKSMQTTRRFDALKVWVSFQARGKDGWSKLITTCMDNAAYLYGKLKADADFDVVTERPPASM